MTPSWFTWRDRNPTASPGWSSCSRVAGSSRSMTDRMQLLAAIRFGDSAFPSGGFAFSSGLEGSHRDGMVQDEDDVTAFVAEQIEGNWHRRDRVLLRRAWTGSDPSTVDALAEAVATTSVLPEASPRACAA